MASVKTSRALLLSIALILAAALPMRAADSSKKPDAAPPAKTDSAQSQSSALDRFETTVKSLKLTDEQKPKIDRFFDKAHEELKALADDTDAADRDKKAKAVSSKLRNEIGEVLTNEQKAELIKKMPQPMTTDAMIDKIKRELEKPGTKLTAEQITRVDAVLDEAKKKLADLQADAKKAQIDPASKVQQEKAQELLKAKEQEVVKEMKEKLSEILSPGK